MPPLLEAFYYPLTFLIMSDLKRHLLSAFRVFLSSFTAIFTVALTTMPTTGYKEFLISTFISACAAGVSAVLKITFETIFPKQ